MSIAKTLAKGMQEDLANHIRAQNAALEHARGFRVPVAHIRGQS
jgi:hypothetical protein